MRSEIAKILRKPVGNENDRNAARLEDAHLVEEAHGLLLGQRCRRLVEDEEPSLFGQRARNHDELLRREVERRHWDIRINVEFEFRDCIFCDLQPPCDVNHSPARRFVVECDVFGHGQLGNDVDLLRHQRDACRLAFGYPGRTIGTAAKVNRSSVASRHVRARENLDERGLSCPVLPQQRDNFAGSDGEIDVVQRSYAGKELG